MDLNNLIKRFLMKLKLILSRILNRRIFSISFTKNKIAEIFFCLLYFLYGINFLKHLIKRVLFYFDLDIRKIVDIENFDRLHPYSVKYIIRNKSTLLFSSPVYSDDKSVFKGLQKEEGENYYAILKSACVIGGSNLILAENDDVLYDNAFSNKNNNNKYIDGAINFYKRNLCLINYNKSTISIDQGILVSGNFSWNYFHLLYEIIVKFKAINEAGIDPEIPLLIDKICQEVPQYLELFSIFNKSGRKLIVLDFRKRYLVDKLYYFSSPNIVPPHFVKVIKIKSNDCLFDLSALDFLRSNLLPLALNNYFPKRIFISRSGASDRRRYNEDEVFGILEKYGFAKIRPDNFSITEQIAIFNQADFIVGGTGAAYTNLLFCKKSCKVICFTNYKIPLSIFSTIANYVGFEMTYIYDNTKTINNKSRLHDPFSINTDNLNMFFAGWLEQDINR